ncbi:MAG TPA: hypothetical protein VKE98_08900 [Gemmataceae bacterium]|nr:hypothetical protein [Gemmataceae bacterium]
MLLAISSIKVSPDGQVIEVKFWPKVAALEKLGQYLGLNKDKEGQPQSVTKVHIGFDPAKEL